MSEVRLKMYIWYKTQAIQLSTYQKLLKLMGIWRSPDRKSLCSFLRHGVFSITKYMYVQWPTWAERNESGIMALLFEILKCVKITVIFREIFHRQNTVFYISPCVTLK